MEKINAPRGTQDILPQDVWKWHTIERIARETAELYHFAEIRTPMRLSTPYSWAIFLGRIPDPPPPSPAGSASGNGQRQANDQSVSISNEAKPANSATQPAAAKTCIAIDAKAPRWPVRTTASAKALTAISPARQNAIAPKTIAICKTAAAAPENTLAKSGESNQRRPSTDNGGGCEGASTSAMSTLDSE